MNPLFPIEIPRRSSHCSGQGEKFLAGMEIYSLLQENEPDKFFRQDFCSACWNQSQKEQAGNRIYWKSKVERKNKVKDLSLVDRALFVLRESFQELNVDDAERYVLCLFLARARRLALRQEYQKEGILYQMYEMVQTEEFLTVKTVQLTDHQIEVIQKSLASKLYEK